MIGSRALAALLPVFLCLQAPRASAQVFVIIPERQEERKNVRWTLADWLVTKRQIDAQNFWLARHTNKVPLDITYGLDVHPGRLGQELDLYILWFGVRARYQQGSSLMSSSAPAELDKRDKNGEVSLQLRLFGGNIQNTNLILRGSYEYNQFYSTTSADGAYGGYSFGPELQIYFANWLGVRGEWRKRFSQKRITTSGAHLSGDGYFAAAFLEQKWVRFEFGYATRQWLFQDSDKNSILDFNDSGYFGRVRLFF